MMTNTEFVETEVENEASLRPSLDQFELTLGVKWLGRIGIVVFLIGLAMAFGYSFQFFGPELKILTGSILAGAMYFAGTKLVEPHKITGRVLQGGGVATGYLALYAMFFMPSVQLFPSGSLTFGIGLALLFAYVSAMIALAIRQNSQTITLLSLGLGYYTASYSGLQSVAFLSTLALVLGGARAVFCHPEWRWVSKASLLGVYWTYCYWSGLPNAHIDGVFRSAETDQLVYLCVQALLLHCISVFPRYKGDVLVNTINTTLFYMMYCFTLPAFEPAGGLEALIALLHLQTYFLVRKMAHIMPAVRDALMIQTIAAGTLAVFSYFDGTMLSTMLTTEALVLGLLAYRNMYPRFFKLMAVALLWCSGCMLLGEVAINHTAASGTLVWSGAWLLAVTAILERTLLKHWPVPAQYAVLIWSGMQYAITLLVNTPPHWMTLVFVATGLALAGIGLILKDAKYRWAGLGWLLLAVGRLVFVDTVHLETLYRIFVYMALGAGLVVVSLGYSMMEKRLQIASKAE